MKNISTFYVKYAFGALALVAIMIPFQKTFAVNAQALTNGLSAITAPAIAGTGTGATTAVAPAAGLGGALTQNTNIDVGNNTFSLQKGILNFNVGKKTVTYPVVGTITLDGGSYTETQADGTQIISGVFDTGFTGYHRPNIAIIKPDGKVFEWYMQKDASEYGFYDNVSHDGTKLHFNMDGSASLGSLFSAARSAINFSPRGVGVNLTYGDATSSHALTLDANGITMNTSAGKNVTVNAGLLQVNGTVAQTAAVSCVLVADANGKIACQPSDRNLKQDIKDTPYGLDTVMKMRPVTYEFKDAKFGKGTQMGFIAQDLEKIVPEAVTQGPDYKSVNYGLLTSVLAKSVQQLNHKIDAFTLNISKLFVTDEVDVKKLCITDDAGAKTCLTKDQVDRIVAKTGMLAK